MRIILFFVSILCLQFCKTYQIDKKAAASQMANLKIERRHRADIIVFTPGSSNYYNDLKYLIIKNDSLNCDTIFPFDIKFYLKSGSNTGWLGADGIIFKDNFFTAFHDTVIKTTYKHKFDRVHIDSVEKTIIRGSRINKIKKKK